MAINHLEGRREIQVSSDLTDPETTSGTDAMLWIRNEVLPDILAKYPTISPSYEGQNREANKLIGSLGFVGPIVLFLIFITIAFTFRSISQPLLLIFMVPFSLTAVAWGHWLHGFPINILSMLGIIALIGIMVNDGLVLIGKFNINLRNGMKFDEAIYEAILELNNKQKFWGKMGHNGREHVKKEHDIHKITLQLEKLYDDNYFFGYHKIDYSSSSNRKSSSLSSA